MVKVRKNYLRAASAKSHLYDKSLDDYRIFPFDPTTAYSIWKKALHKSALNGKDKSTNREKLNLHVLRKFFRTRLGAAGIPIDVVEALMGHEGYLTEVYRRYSLEDLRKFYLRGESALLVFTEAQEVTKLRQEVEEKNKSLNNSIVSLVSEKQKLKSRLEELEQKDGETKRELRDLKDQVALITRKFDELIKD